MDKYKVYKLKRAKENLQVGTFIYQLGESAILTQKSKPVDQKDITSEDFQEKIDYIKSCLLKYRKITGLGRGIAAPQVGINLQFAVIYTKEKLVVIINPKILKASPNLLWYPEICMSTSSIITPVTRPAWIEFEYLDEFSKKQVWKEKNDNEQNKILNRVFQHEIDHLNGILALSKVERVSDISLDSDPDFFKKAKFREIK